jgi:uncharacterized damage-inducible protein DinB
VADPNIVAARELLDENLEGLHQSIAGASVELLNRRPLGDETNSLAVIVTHALYSTRSWLSLATGAELPPRDRPAEFRTVATSAEELVSSVGAVGDECRSLLGDDATYDPATERTPTWRSGPDDVNEPTSAAWALIHAISHLQEHVAHAQLTRQILDAAG